MNQTVYFLLSLFYIGMLTAFALITPRATRAQLLFGVQVDLQTLPADLPLRLRRRWDMGIIAIALVALAVSLATMSRANPAWLVVQIMICLVGEFAFFLYLRRAALPFAAAPSHLRPVELPMLRYRDIVPPILEALPALIFLSMIALTVIFYPALPDRIPMHFGFDGTPDRWDVKSSVNVSLTLIPALVMYALLTLTAAWVPRSSRLATSPSLRQSLEARRHFVVALSWYLYVVKVLVLILLAVVQMAIFGVALGWGNPIRFALALSVVIAGVSVAGAIYLAVRLGQGGNREMPVDHEKLEGAAADERHWRLGVFYYNPADPALFVEKRFGIGLTVNFANRKAWWLAVLLMALIVLPLLVALAYRH